jgi:hypothetical protein
VALTVVDGGQSMAVQWMDALRGGLTHNGPWTGGRHHRIRWARG